MSKDKDIIIPQKISEIPQSIMTRIISLIAFPLGLGAIMMISGFVFEEFNVAPLIGAALILAAIGAIRTVSIILLIMSEGYVVLKGEVISVTAERFDKKTKIIQMENHDSGLTLAFRYSQSRVIDVGTPVTLYMISNEPIENKDEIGPFVEGYLQVVFANVADDSEEGDGKMSAADFLKK